MNEKIAILSINPCHIEKIFSGEKFYEYRKKIPLNISHLVVYATAPIKKIVALAEVDAVISGTPEEIWNMTKNGSGISHKFFESYFINRNAAYAIKLKNILKLHSPKQISILNNVKNPPQSYMYARESLENLYRKLEIF